MDELKAMDESRDTKAVHDLLDGLTAAWNAGDADAYGRHFTEDATYVVFNGRLLTGTREITETHRWLFGGPLKGSRLGDGADGTGTSDVRFLTRDVAHVMVSAGMSLPGQAAPDPAHDSLITYVAVRRDEGWRFAAFQNTRREAA